MILLISNRDHGKIKTGPGACSGASFNFSEAPEISYIIAILVKLSLVLKYIFSSDFEFFRRNFEAYYITI